MAEELRNYQLQLQQVGAALLTDPDNEELNKLKTDLEEVIALTQDLINTQDGESNDVVYSSASNDDDVTASLLAAEEGIRREQRKAAASTLRVGDKCMAKWKEDSKLYEARIEKIIGNEVQLIFEGYNSIQTVSADDIEPMDHGTKRGYDEDGKLGRGHSREYLKKKKQKKQQRFKQIEEDREGEKNKWLSFKTKTVKKGAIKPKSIFASPESVSGRVGIGTCGISGKPMTEFTHGEKWKKGS